MKQADNDLKGNPGQRVRKPRNFGSFDPNKAPTWLDRTGKQYWQRIAPALAQEGILNPVTADLVGALCRAYSTYREAGECLEAQGRVVAGASGTTKANPWQLVERQAFEAMVKVYKELGIAGSPVAPVDDALDTFLAEGSVVAAP